MVLNFAEGIEILGREGANLLEEAAEIQPDLILYVLYTSDNSINEKLSELKSLCNWTRIIVFAASPISKESFNKVLRVCDGYIEGPILPGYLLKALELACYSNYFFFMGKKGYQS